MITNNLTIINKLGLHARAAAKLANTANRYDCDIQLSCKGKSVDCKSVMALMLLAASKGTNVELQCAGDDEHVASDNISYLINNRFDEPE